MLIYFRVVDIYIRHLYFSRFETVLPCFFFLRFIADLHETFVFLQHFIGVNADTKN